MKTHDQTFPKSQIIDLDPSLCEN